MSEDGFASNEFTSLGDSDCLTSLRERPTVFYLNLRTSTWLLTRTLKIPGHMSSQLITPNCLPLICFCSNQQVTIEKMDSITHTLTGAVIARAINDEKVGNWGTIAGLAMGAFPDSDFVLGLFNRQFYLEYHRDFTHSLILIPFYALFFSWVFVKIIEAPLLLEFSTKSVSLFWSAMPF